MKNIDLNNIYEWPLTLRFLVFGLIGAVVFYLLYRWDGSGLSTELINARQKENEIKEQLEVTLSKQAAVKKEAAQFPKVQLTLLEWQKKLIHYSGMPQLINEILKIGAANHIYFSLFTPSTEIKVQNYFKIPIKIVATGSYHDLAVFISEVANLPSIVVIGNFSITSEMKAEPSEAKPVASPTKEGLLTGEFSLEAYYLAPENKKK